MAAAEGQGNKINLSMLIDFLLQKTYHELTVLAELLPRKSDIERKIEIVQFASRTRQQFVRLLALVKWASSADRVDKCQVISSYLDQQSMVFVDTADMLARMSRETLVQARLPTFCLPAAVDVLTTGTYSRLPTCIRDKIVPPDPITTSEKTTTLEQLNQIIQHRLVTSDLPPQMSNISIGNGRVKFHVRHEFEVTLTIMGDDPSLPWRLLSIEILVQDIETGDGKPLVHDLQINYLHRLAQSRLFQEGTPLTDLYNCIHIFCLSLQLQVLYFQAKQLIHERWHDNIRIENNIIEQRLTLQYWRNIGDQQQLSAQNSGQIYKLIITYKSNNNPALLRIEHEPEIKYHQEDKSHNIVNPGELSIEKLLMHTVRLQSNVKLSNLLNLLSEDLKVNSKVLLDRQNSSLAIQTCANATRCEVLLITIDTRSGHFRVGLGDGEENPICSAMEKALNANPKQFPVLLGDARCQLHLCKCRRTVARLPVFPCNHLPISVGTQHKLSKLGKHRFFLQFKNHKNYYLVVDVLSTENTDKVIEQYYLLRTKSIDADNLDVKNKEVQVKPKKEVKLEEEKSACKATQDQSAVKNLSIQPLFLEAEEMVEIGSTQSADFPGSVLKGFGRRNALDNSTKRKLEDTDDEEAEPNKKAKTTNDLFKDCASVSSFQAHLDRLVCLCDSRIPLMPLCEELRQHQVIHDGVQSEAGVGLCVPILYLPVPTECDADLVSTLQESILSCILRFTGQHYQQYAVEMIFTTGPFQSNQEKPEAKRVVLTYDCIQNNDSKELSHSAVQQFMDDWCSMCKLYTHALELELCQKDNTSHVRHMFHVGSYTYKQITLQYEPDRQNVVSIQWSVPDSQFVLSLYHGAHSGTDNPHHVMAEHLQKDFNKRLNLPYLMQILHETWKPLTSLNKLSTMPQLGVMTRSLMVQRNFSILPQSPTSVFMIYRTNAMEIHFKAKNLVSIRDAALSTVDPSKPKLSLSTISNLKPFLQLFVDDIAKAGGIPSRRGSEADDEIPPSPVTMDSEPSAMDIQFTSPQPVSSGNLSSSPLISRVSPQPTTSRAGFTPSPNPMNAPSPNNPYSSPSPASFIGHSPHPYMQMVSPGPWSPLPGGSQVNRYRQNQPVSGPSTQPPTPPRQLIAKSWASTSPTILSHTAFNRLCTPMRTQLRYDCIAHLSQLEMFLGSMFLKKHLCRAVQGDELTQMLKTDASLVAFKTSSLQCIVKIEQTTYTSLRLTVKPLQENLWMRDELNILERFFETRVACPPYKANSLTSFARILTVPASMLKDLVRIIRLEMNPDPNNKWRVEWCLTIPPNGPKMPFSIGTIAVVFKTKLLLFIQLTRAVPQGTISYDSIVIPLMYDQSTNTTQQLDVSRQSSSAQSSSSNQQTDVTRQSNSSQPSSSMAAVNAVLKKFNESPASKTGECTLFPAVMELARNLVLPPSSHMSYSSSGYSDITNIT